MSSLNMIPVKNIFILSKNCIEVSECNLGFRAHFLILASNGLEAFLGPRPTFTFLSVWQGITSKIHSTSKLCKSYILLTVVASPPEAAWLFLQGGVWPRLYQVEV